MISFSMIRWGALLFAAAGAATLVSCSDTSSSQSPDSNNSTPIRVTINGQTLNAHLWDNAPAQDLLGRLPLTLEFSDYNNQEKLGHLNEPLSMSGMPQGDSAASADIGWYEPGNNIVFYYSDVGYWNGIARIGRFDDPIDLVKAQTSNFSVTIERVE